MFRSLARKELHSLVPFIWLVLFFVALDLVFFVLSEFPDQYPLRELLLPEDSGQEQVTFIIAFALASGLLVREHAEGTLGFLDALPVGRSQVFLVKVLLGLGVLWLMPILDFFLSLAVYELARTSLESSVHRWGFLTGMLLSMASTAVYFSLGLALSFFRRFSFLVLGLLVGGYLLLDQLNVPYIALFNIFSLAAPVFHGQRWLIPVDKLLVQLTGAALCLGMSMVAFRSLGDPAQRLAARLARRRGMAIAAVAGLAVSILVWVALGAYFAMQIVPDENGKITYREWAKARAQTQSFSFVYSEQQAMMANHLIDRADAAAERVRAFLEAQPITRIQADLTGSAPHTAGVAHWKNVRMALAGLADPAEALAVFAHETTHVYIDHESNSVLSDQFNSTRFFHEGLASYVEYRFFRPAEALGPFRRPALAARARTLVRLSDLFGDSEFCRRWDADLVYPIGEVFVTALVSEYGESAPGRVIRAFARPNAPRNLQGLTLWQDVLQACGFDLSIIENRFLALLDQGVEDEQPFLTSLPRLRGLVDHEAKGPVIRATYEGDAPGFLLLRYRPRADTKPEDYELLYSGGSQRFEVPAAHLSERTFWYQLGWRVPGASQPVFEAWVEAPAR